jgi:hypothetical protein
VRAFGVAMQDLAIADLPIPRNPFQIGVPPSRIDILTSLSGVTFDDAWSRRVDVAVGDLRVAVIGRDDFIANKQATGRPRDLLDIELLPPEG